MADYIDKWQAVTNLIYAGLEDAQKAVNAIQYMPAADVQPVVHGFWMEDHTEVVCSVCGQRVDGEIVFMIKPNALPGFCPNPMCGAKMI